MMGSLRSGWWWHGSLSSDKWPQLQWAEEPGSGSALSDCNGVTTAVSRQPLHWKHHTKWKSVISINYFYYHKLSYINSENWTEIVTLRRLFGKKGFLVRDVVLFFYKCFKWTGIKTIRLMDTGNGTFKISIVQLGELR